ncbi:hypothetical protein F5972_27230 [Microbispora cellulosiformans]|uniref:Uncharacterized protein n=1 Tax=Microbispora cellulosiformans TaxID=2614688 RepID=A0A5J5JWX9_9ACTN|nr:hypothetical protein [Microbispora cellulosiformans]KAA9375453.1 hypothetical protein F5972_27230 [Microbispora cellulosiformans]
MSDEPSFNPSRFVQISTGAAPIINLHLLFQQSVEGKSYRRFAAESLLLLSRCFAYPPGFGEAREILPRSRIVLLDGAPGSGRQAAAQMLLHELRGGEMAFREMPLNDENDRDGRLLACDAIVDGDLLLLDLSAADDRYWARAHRELLDAHAEVREHRACLVVVLPHNRAERLQPTLEQYRVEIGRPAELQVLRHYLRQAGFNWQETHSASPATDRFLSARPRLEDVAHFALLVIQARKRVGGAGEIKSWCEEAYGALYDRDSQVTADSRTLEGDQRALLLATAMLHGAHADVIHEATYVLLHEAKHPLEDRSPLQHRGLDIRFEEIHAVLGRDGRVHFRDLGYDAAARRHLWIHLPDLRASLREWVRLTAASQSVPLDDRDNLVDRFTELCLHDDRYRGMLVSLIVEWTARPMNGAGRRAAAQVLTVGLLDQRQGRFFRHQIYEWCRQGALSETLAEVIVRMCSEVMAVRNPYEAVVRLHHRARRETGTTQAREALLELVRADRRLLRLMFSRLNDQFTQDNRYRADPGLFLDLADSDLLASTGGARAPLARSILREQVTVGWSVVFERSGEEVWRERVQQWLEAAGESGPWADVLIDVLVEGARQRPPVLSALYSMAGELERSRPEWSKSDVRLHDRLYSKIRSVLGIQVA